MSADSGDRPARLARARINLAEIDEYRRQFGHPASDPDEAEYIAHIVVSASHVSPDLGRKLARLLSGTD